QTLANGQRINGQRQAIDKRVPGLRLPPFDGLKVTLHNSHVAQRPKALKLVLPDAPAGRGKIPVPVLPGNFEVQSQQLAGFVAAGMLVGQANRRQIESQQNLGQVSVEKPRESGWGFDLREAKRSG